MVSARRSIVCGVLLLLLLLLLPRTPPQPHAGMVVGVAHRSETALQLSALGHTLGGRLLPVTTSLFGGTAQAPLDAGQCTRGAPRGGIGTGIGSGGFSGGGGRGPLVLGGVGGSGGAGVLGEALMALRLRTCADMDAKLNDLYLLTPEAVHLQDMVRQKRTPRNGECCPPSADALPTPEHAAVQ